MKPLFFWLQNLYMIIIEKLKVIEKPNEKRERGRGEESIEATVNNTHNLQIRMLPVFGCIASELLLTCYFYLTVITYNTTLKFNHYLISNCEN